MALTKVQESMLVLSGGGGGSGNYQYNVKMFGATGDGVTNDTEAFQDALDACLADNKPLYIPAGTYLVAPTGVNKYCLYNGGVSMYGDGAKNTIIAPFGNVATDVDFLLVNFTAGVFNDFMFIKDFAIWPAYPQFNTAIKGKRCIWLVSNVEDINVGKLLIDRLYLFPSNDYSIEYENNAALLPQGCPSNSLVSNNSLWGGLRLSGVGDSNVITRNIIRSPNSFKVGIDLTVTDNGLGSAGHTVIRENNIDAYAGAILAHNSRHLLIDANNIEQSTGPGTSVGAVIDLRGDVGRLDMPVVTNNLGAIFGTSIAVRSLSLQNCDRAYVHGNKFDTNIARDQAIWVRGGSNLTLFGVNELTNTWTQKVTNEGTNTRSLVLQNGYTPS